ncbi:MAG: hypothetical protein DWH82_01605 [Planctomycetota bacterium]|nr:MAG: hypothetical protein DWH82_01605 [Planctomycetota bacterium]
MNLRWLPAALLGLGIVWLPAMAQEKAAEKPKDTPKEAPKDAPKDTPKEAPKDAPKDTPKEAPKDAPKEAPKDAPKVAPKDAPKEAPKTAPAAGAKVKLAWTFTKDKTFYQTMTTTTKQELVVQGNKVNQEQKQAFVFAWTPIKQEGDTWTLKQKIESVEMAIDIGGTKIEYNSKNAAGPGNPLSEFFKALVGAEFTVVLDAKENKIIKVLDREEFVKKLVNANPAMQPLLSGILDEKAFIDMSEPTFRVVPNKEVAVGDTWELKNTLKLGPIGSYVSEYKYTYSGKADALDKISIAATLKYEPGSSSSGALPFKIEKATLESTKATGEVLFDTAKGRPSKSSMLMEVKGNLTIDISGSKTPVELTQSQTTTTETSDTKPGA